MIKLAVRYVKKNEEQTLRRWLSELNRRQEETFETFSHEGTLLEQAHVAEISGRMVLIYLMDADDHEKTARALEQSTLPLDLEHRQIMARVLEERVKVELLYEYVKGCR